ncbi:MAG: carbonic anhydrase, partial [Kurthia sp.]
MNKLDEILAFNKQFVENKDYVPYVSDGVPSRKLAIVTCMDARLIELLQKSINIKNGDAKMIKTAGAQINNPYGSIMRSILVAIYALKADEVLVIGHRNCGMNSMDPSKVVESMKERG